MEIRGVDRQPVKSGPGRPEVIFANWREMLNGLNVSGAMRRSYAQAIEGYLEHCRHNGVSVGVETARGFVADALRREDSL